MSDVETIVNSQPVQAALGGVAKALKWGEVIVEIKDGKVVMTKLRKDIKHS